MKNVRKYLVSKLPAPIKSFLKLLVSFFVSKEKAELMFQKRWAGIFSENKDKVLEYWKRYRYLDEIIAICRPTVASRILDVGCGISSVLHYLPGDKVGADQLADAYRKTYLSP